ncbi:MAG: universal stress protein [Actinomycetota bacterium]
MSVIVPFDASNEEVEAVSAELPPVEPAHVRTILAAVSTPWSCDDVLAMTATLARGVEATVVAFHVREWPFTGSEWVFGGGGFVESTSHASAFLDAVLGQLRAHGVQARGLTGGGRPSEVAEEIVEAARREGADLIVIGSHHHSRVYEVLAGGVARRVRRMSEVPVVVVPRRSHRREARLVPLLRFDPP